MKSMFYLHFRKFKIENIEELIKIEERHIVNFNQCAKISSPLPKQNSFINLAKMSLLGQ